MKLDKTNGMANVVLSINDSTNNSTPKIAKKTPEIKNHQQKRKGKGKKKGKGKSKGRGKKTGSRNGKRHVKRIGKGSKIGKRNETGIGKGKEMSKENEHSQLPPNSEKTVETTKNHFVPSPTPGIPFLIHIQLWKQRLSHILNCNLMMKNVVFREIVKSLK